MKVFVRTRIRWPIVILFDGSRRKIESGIAPPQLPGWWCDRLEGKISTLKDKFILSSGGCQMRPGVAAISQGVFHAIMKNTRKFLRATF
jgi:hypothetical protein